MTKAAKDSTVASVGISASGLLRAQNLDTRTVQRFGFASRTLLGYLHEPVVVDGGSY